MELELVSQIRKQYQNIAMTSISRFKLRYITDVYKKLGDSTPICSAYRVFWFQLSLRLLRKSEHIFSCLYVKQIDLLIVSIK